MIMSDGAIREAMRAGEISIDPPARDDDIRGVGLRLYLGEDLLIPVSSDDEIDLAHPQSEQFMSRRMDATGYILQSQDYVLAATREKISASRGILCTVDGRSSIARSGLFIHCSSAAIDNIHDGARAIVLELYNCSRRALRLRPGLPIAMMMFARLEGTIQQSASSQYADQHVLLPPRPGSLP